ncbi:hypothetical protein COT58_02435 [Candidatus Micrarchaeota archaeon CG09_land_8_20_14_0_10_60_16]|nr:MAG: hypothetical protein COT58_02435 [Candidatus Micrarchaeota archaeon CG09_land_8_20_14_0_10_60_16]
MVSGEIVTVSLWPGAAIAVFLIILTIVIIAVFKKMLVNTVLGVIALLVVNYLSAPYGIKVAVTLLTVIVCALFGLAGLGALILLGLLGVQVS